MRYLPLYITLFLSILALTNSSLAQEANHVSPQLEIGYAPGGQFYLNYLESNPMLFIRTGIDVDLSPKTSLDLLTGVELLRDERFIPVMARFNYGTTNLWHVHLGYAFGLWTEIENFEEYDFIGGPLAGFGYGRYILQNGKLNLSAHIGYEFRSAVLDFSTTNPNNEIRTQLDYHFVSLGITARI